MPNDFQLFRPGPRAYTPRATEGYQMLQFDFVNGLQPAGRNKITKDPKHHAPATSSSVRDVLVGIMVCRDCA
ncbi:MAG TPA: hypothetical protein VMB03_31045 [Bryobacteraceae bacterium]|nr:hypothetical protein [Bryobacteraceae bacterium]